MATEPETPVPEFEPTSVPAATPRLRRFPFPFRAALAISNDTDGMDWAAFEDWHAFVCGTGHTPYGQGLGLEVSDSFWIWSDTGAFALRHAPPWDDPGTPAPETGRIVELAREGWLDTLHSFGDWDPAHHLDRDTMRRGLDLLDRLGLRPPVHVNHGGGLRLHNIGGPWASYQSGDDPDNPSYALDLLRAAGFRFYWIDVLYENDRFGENLDPALLPAALHPRPQPRWLQVTERHAHAEPGGPSRPALSGLGPDRAARIARHMSDNLLVPLVGRDDSAFWGFKRFRGHEAPNTASFALQASSAHLDLLEAAGGACVVYQHFGVWRALGRPKRHASQIESRRPLLDDNAVWAFRDIAARQAAGRLLVTTTARLLGYVWLRDMLRFTATETEAGTGLTITLEATDCPIEGHRPVDPAALAGLAFQVPAETGPVTLRSAQGMVLATRRAPDPTAPGWDAVYLPWERREFPQLAASPAPRLNPERLAGRPPPPGIQQIRHRALSPAQADRLYQMITTIEMRTVMPPDIRDDLRAILPEWSTLPVPPVLQAAGDYVRKMHAEPFSAYHDRLRRLTGGGGVALDAGSGTATWSLPMADLFDRVIAIDKNRPRVDFARWLVERAGCDRIEVGYGDVTDLDLAEDSVDFVFCFGVVISYLSLRAVLREFRRVTRPGGWIYVCVNGIGWSQHLRDDRGARSPSLRIQGQRGFYNTHCRARLGGLNDRISQLLARTSRDEEAGRQLAAAAGIAPAALTGLLLSCHQAKTLAELALPEARSPEGLARLLDRLLAALEGEAPDSSGDGLLVDTLAEIARDCGEEFVAQFGLDLVNLLTGRRDGFSYPTAGRGYTPEEVAALCAELGLADFRWAGEGELVGPGGQDIPAPCFFAPEYHGRLGVWEFLVRRP